jgi:hypothetical protein
MLNHDSRAEWLAGWEIGKRKACKLGSARLIHNALKVARGADAFGQGYIAALSAAVGAL